jgi:hypothetical protein
MPLRGDTVEQDFTRAPIEIPDSNTDKRRTMSQTPFLSGLLNKREQQRSSFRLPPRHSLERVTSHSMPPGQELLHVLPLAGAYPPEQLYIST